MCRNQAAAMAVFVRLTPKRSGSYQWGSGGFVGGRMTCHHSKSNGRNMIPLQSYILLISDLGGFTL